MLNPLPNVYLVIHGVCLSLEEDNIYHCTCVLVSCPFLC